MNDLKSTLKFYGHNCFIVETADCFLAIDPWLTKKGAFFGSWFQYPKNHHLLQSFIDLTNKKKGVVYITHEHEDHFDIETIQQINKQTTILIPRFQDDFLRKKIFELGFDVKELQDSERLQVSKSLQVELFLSDVGVNHDSAILVTTEDFSFLNQNDCKIFDRLHEIKQDITYYSVQFSGATSHPVCYESYSAEEKSKITTQKVNAKLQNVVKAINFIKPKLYIPAAGPAVFPFMDKSLSMGRNNIFIHQDVLHLHMSEQGINNIFYARPGDVVEDSKNTTPILPPSSSELDVYRKSVTCNWDLISEEFSKEKLIKAVELRLDEIWDLDFTCEFIICFKWGRELEDQIYIDLSNKIICESFPQEILKIYTVESDPKYFSLMYSGARWQDISLSLRGRLKRTPDIFDNYVNLFLYSDVENIREAFIGILAIPKERIKVTGYDGKSYEISRYCPHQGADLSDAEINQKNQVVCPRHSWCFALEEDGKCISNNLSIESKQV